MAITCVKSIAAPPKTVNGVTQSRAFMLLVGLSTDTEPTTSFGDVLIANGSELCKMDEGKTYKYDEDGAQWIEQSGGSSSGGITAADVVAIIQLAMDNTPITRIVVEDAAETELTITNWDTEYVVPGTSLETLTITLPETTPTALSSCIKVTILGIVRHADPEDESEDPLLIPPTISLPEGLVIVGGYPEQDGDRWVLTIDNNMTATAMVIPNSTT